MTLARCLLTREHGTDSMPHLDYSEAPSGLFGAVWAQAELRKVLTTTGADVMKNELPVGQAHDAF